MNNIYSTFILLRRGGINFEVRMNFVAAEYMFNDSAARALILIRSVI
jgi:hypothetical protein